MEKEKESSDTLPNVEISIKQPRKKARPGRLKNEKESSDTLPNVETGMERPKKERPGRLKRRRKVRIHF